METMSWTTVGGVIVDLALISVILSTTYKGFRDGLVGVAFKILTFIVALIITFILYKPVSQMIIDKTNWDEKLTVAIENNLTDVIVNEDGEVATNPNSNISENIVAFINKTLANTTNTLKINAITFVSQNLSIVMIRYGTMVVLFVVSEILLSFLKSIFELVAMLPFIRLFNKAGGIIYGVIKGFLIIYFVLAIFSVFSPIISKWGIISIIQKGYLASRMYNNNILLNFILKK